MTKCISKYNGILYILTQNINDFMGNANIKEQAQGIISNCLYQFVHHLAASDLADYDNLIAASKRLNECQKEATVTAPNGTCVFSVSLDKLVQRPSRSAVCACELPVCHFYRQLARAALWPRPAMDHITFVSSQASAAV